VVFVDESAEHVASWHLVELLNSRGRRAGRRDGCMEAVTCVTCGNAELESPVVGDPSARLMIVSRGRVCIAMVTNRSKGNRRIPCVPSARATRSTNWHASAGTARSGTVPGHSRVAQVAPHTVTLDWHLTLSAATGCRSPDRQATNAARCARRAERFTVSPDGQPRCTLGRCTRTGAARTHER
jgi:hypothetical protein